MLRQAMLFILLFTTTAHGHYFYRQHQAFERPVPVIHLKNNAETFNCIVQSSGYSRHAHESFMDMLTEKHPLSALYFGNEDFRLSHIFTNCYAPLNTENYNPYMRIIKIQPRVQYTESGVMLSAKVERAFGTKRKCRAGLSISAPFMIRTITRNDKGDRDSVQTQDVINKGEVTIYGRDGDGSLNGDQNTDYSARAYRLDFIEALGNPDGYTDSITYTEGGNTQIYGITIDRDSGSTITGALLKKRESLYPKRAELGVYEAAFEEDNSQIFDYVPADLSTIKEGNLYEFENSNDYTSMLDSSTKTIEQRVADQDAKSQLWFIKTYQVDDGQPNENSSTIADIIDSTSNAYNDNVYEWLHDRGFQFADQQCIGFGDTTLQAYVSYPTSDHAALNFAVGAVLPTAAGKLDPSNPYSIQLGNRGHFEFFSLAEVVVEIPRSVVCFSTNVKYTGVLPAVENVVATPKGSLINNIGSPTTARIAWYTISGETWLHFRHPHTDDISFSLGYNWFSKSKDTIEYLEDTVESWLGRSYNANDKTFTTANPLTLDAQGAARHTSAIAHTIRGQMSCTLSDWFTINGGCSYVIAGKNSPATLEFSLGCTITY